MARLRNYFANAALILASIVLGCLLVEFAVALFSPQAVVNATAPDIFFVRYDEELGWVNREGVSGRYVTAPAVPPTSVRINRRGMRGGPISAKKGPGVKRILMLGDSNTFGYGVEESQRFSDLLSGTLPQGFDVLNLGVFGYGTDQEALLFEREGLQYHPDIVVLAFSAGDLSDNMNSINAGYTKPYFKVEGGRLNLHNTPVPRSSPYLKSASRISPLKNFLYRNSHLYRLVLKRFVALNRYMFDSVSEMSEEEGMDVTLAVISGLRDMCRANGCRLVVLLISHETWVSAESGGPGGKVGYYPFLSMMLSRFGIPVIDTTEIFARRFRHKGWLFLQDDPVHLNARGNALVAESLRQGLARLGIVAPLLPSGDDAKAAAKE